jgi:hypothetical protein
MTLPNERTRAIRNARVFLRSLLDPKQTSRVPKEIRRQAYWCLRHFPTEFDMDVLVKGKVPAVFGEIEKEPDEVSN